MRLSFPLLRGVRFHLLRHRSVDGDDEEAINLAIEVVGESRDDSLVHQLVEFLMGDVDGSPKV